MWCLLILDISKQDQMFSFVAKNEFMLKLDTHGTVQTEYFMNAPRTIRQQTWIRTNFITVC